MQLLYNLAIVLLGIYPRKMKTYVHQSLCWMFIDSLFVIAKNWKQYRCPSRRDGSTNCGTFIPWNQDMKQPEWIPRELCWVEKYNPKSLHNVWFHLHNIFKWQNYTNGKCISGCQGLSRGWRWKGSDRGCNRAAWGFYGDGQFWYLDCVIVSFLVEILY